MLKSQEDEISNLLIEYAAGNYTVKGKLSEKQDEVDMIIQGINMLGEELMATNISKDYFLNIYNSVTDLIIILDKNQNILDINSSVCSLFKIEPKEVIGKSIYFSQHYMFKTIDEEIRLYDGKLGKYYSYV